MRAILGKLIEEEKSKCEEEQRKVLFNLSALGGMHAMLGQSSKAAEMYSAGLVESKTNREPVAVESTLEATLVGGPDSLRFEAPKGSKSLLRPLGPVRWTLPRAAWADASSAGEGLSRNILHDSMWNSALC